jgi:methyl-accepting chemotaxis protein
MGIKAKLMALIFVVVIAGLVSVGGYTVMTAPVEAAKRELQEFEAIINEFRTFRADLNSLITGQLVEQLQLVGAKRNSASAKLKGISTFTALPRINESVVVSLNITSRIDSIITDRWPGLEQSATKALAGMSAVALDVFGDNSRLSVSRMLVAESAINHPQAGDMRQAMDDFFIEIASMDANTQSLIQVVSTQFGIIQQESAKAARRAMNLALGMALASIAVAVLFALSMATRIAKTIKTLAAGIGEMKCGDLTVNFKVGSKDELGQLAQDLDAFARSLKDAMATVQSSSSTSVTVKEELVATATEASASVHQINANTASISGNILSLSDTVGSVQSAVAIADSGIQSLEQLLFDQSAMVEESTASVTEMIASIGSVAEATVRRRTAGEALVESARKGGEKLAATVAIIRDITSNVDEISGTARMIRDLANQTNLLAMNAAIEAAHAGDAGRGFAIVADEIRRLAEASSSNSKRISGVLKEVVAKIEQAASSGDSTKQVFSQMDSEVAEASGAFGEIAAAMSQLKAGGEQILAAMASLRKASAEVEEGRISIADSARLTGTAVGAVERIASEVKGSVADISAGMADINAAVANVATLSERLGQMVGDLDSELRRFRTEGACGED